MRKRYKKKKTTQDNLKPHKRKWVVRWKSKEFQSRKLDEKEIREKIKL